MPVVVMISDLALRSSLLKAGADDFILLPLEEVELAACMQRYQRMDKNYRRQEEAELQAARMAYLVLISRLVSEHLALPEALDKP